MNQQPSSRARNLTLAAAAGQAGCWTLIIVVAALFVGLALDRHFGLRGPFTIGVLLLSIPLSLFIMVRIALGSVSHIQQTPPTNSQHKSLPEPEEDDL